MKKKAGRPKKKSLNPNFKPVSKSHINGLLMTFEKQERKGKEYRLLKKPL